MSHSSLVGLGITAVAMLVAFETMYDTAPALFTGVVTVGTFGAGIFYAVPTDRWVARPWRHSIWRPVARRTHVATLTRVLSSTGWNRQVRHPIDGRGALQHHRATSAGALISHACSAAIHSVAAVALASLGEPVWAGACLALGLRLHVWPALLQIEILGRIDEIQHLHR